MRTPTPSKPERTPSLWRRLARTPHTAPPSAVAASVDRQSTPLAESLAVGLGCDHRRIRR